MRVFAAQISGGERHLTLLARALAQASPLMVMDEPTASLDFGNQVKVLERIAEMAHSGIGVLLSTHDPDQAFLLGHRVALLHRGTLAALRSSVRSQIRLVLRYRPQAARTQSLAAGNAQGGPRMTVIHCEVAVYLLGTSKEKLQYLGKNAT